MRSILLALSALSSVSVAAQLEIGHRFGIAWSEWKLEGGDSDAIVFWHAEQEKLAGFTFSVPVQYTIARHVRLSSGLQFMQRGYMWNAKQQYYHHYLQVPLAIGANITIGALVIRPSVGASFGYNTGGQYRYGQPGTDDIDVTPIGRDGDKGHYYTTPPTEWSALASLHLGYAFQRSSLEVGFGYLHGLTNVMYVAEFTDVNGLPVEAPTAFNRTLFLELGYHIGLSKRAHHPSVSATDSTLQVVVPATSGARLRVGQRFGATYSSIAFNGDLAEENARINAGAEPLLALGTAIMFDIPLGKRSSLLIEAAYTQKGWNCQWYPRPTTGNDVLRMNYVELPVLFKHRFGSARFRPFLSAGPVGSLGLGGIDRYGSAGTWNGGFYETLAVTFDNDHDRVGYEQFDLSASLGAGCAWQTAESELVLDVRYQHGFLDFVPDQSVHLYSNSATAYHRNWLVSLGYLVPWGK